MNEYFEKYGEIETIEVLNPKNEEANKTKKLEAYVTFQRDIFAYAAVMDNDNRVLRKLKCEYNIQPADTWKQPSEQNPTVESMQLDEDEGYVPPIFILKEDCFEKLFQYLDLGSLMNLLVVCKKINTLVFKHGFKHVKNLEIHRDNKCNPSLAQLRRMLKCMGEHMKQLHFTWRTLEKPDRFLRILGKHVGTWQ